ncbi:MAG: 3-hydroxyacyl-CoA dehydrogenase NAD-binding domain-containing protein [Bacteroidota bacterium]
MNKFKKIGVIGAGTMGRGIALSCIQAKYETIVFDIQESNTKTAQDYIFTQLLKAVEKGKSTNEDATAAKNLLKMSNDIGDLAGCDLVIEAIIEDYSVKNEVFEGLELVGISDSAVIATNTSSLSVNALAASLKNPERFVGLHFFNPAHIMKLVEIVQGARTSDAVVERCVDFIKSLGKSPVIAKDVPGFIVNRVARNYYNEAMRIATEGIAEPGQIDRLMKSVGFKMGPFELMDLIGNDVNLEVTKSVWAQYFNEPRFAPSLMQQQVVNAKTFGKKSGRGFYDYAEENKGK